MMSDDAHKLDFVVVDVFTAKRYEGNPLAIVRMPPSVKLTQEQKQNIAREFNLSETTFLHEPTDSESAWTVDIFTVQAELPFAGHPTIGTACFALSELAQRLKARGTIQGKFNLKAGPVQLQYDTVTRTAKAAIPHNVHVHDRVWTRDELLAVQPGLAEFVGEAKRIPIVSIVKGMTFVFIELDSLEALQKVTTASRSISVDGLDQGWDDTFVGTYFYVQTSQAGLVRHVRTRMIEGSLEDPATGSAASGLAAYLSLLYGNSGDTLDYLITQGVEMGRKSDISVQVAMRTENAIETITLGGGAVPVKEGRLVV